jgi:peptidoglycan/xylan/chitin deacetylase (PgdA/CDA1 family)
MLPTARALGFSVALWSIDPKDWRLQGLHTTAPVRPADELADLIVARVRSGLGRPHPVILLHDGGGYRGAGVVALTRIIEEYRAQGYRFVRLDGRS